jgi:hypothetical protein
MATPYENQLIGAFLYALGYHSGQHNASTTSVNLFQQTPLDQSFGDVIVGASRCFALEFKRDERLLDTERDKWSEGGFAAALKEPEMARVAARAHFAVYPKSAASELELICCQYAKYMLPAASQLRTIPALALIRAIHAGERGAKGAVGASPPELERYLHYLRTFRRRTTGGREGSTGSWLAVAQKQNGFQLMTASSLTQLLEPRRDYVPEPELGPQRRERKHERGHEFGM